MKKKLFHNIAFLGVALAFGASLIACNQEQPPTEKVVWAGVADVELDLNDPAPNLLLGVSAKQGSKELSVKIDNERSDDLDTSVAGAFSIYYVAYDGEKAIAEDLNGEYIRTVTVSRGVYINNANFETTDKAGWGGNGNAGSVMSWDIDATQHALVVNITNSGEEYWQNQVEFNGLEVKAHTTYEIVIRAKSATPRNIGASLEVPSLGYKCIDPVSVNSIGYEMTSEYADYKFYYTADEDYTGVKFGIILGRFNEKDETENTVTIDSVKINKLAKEANSTGVVFTGEASVKVRSFEEYQALPAIIAVDKDGHSVNLVREGAVQGVEFNEDLAKAVFGEMWKVVDAEGNLSYFRRQINYSAAPDREHVYDTLDGTFEYGTKFWAKEENDLVTITTTDDGAVKIASTGDTGADADWKAQLQQNNNGGKLLKDHAYKMVVEAKINNTAVTTLRAEFCAGAGNPAAKKDMVFNAVDTYQTFETDDFQPSADVVDGAYRVGLLVGEYSAAYELTVKSIQVVESNPYVRTTEYETMNGDFSRGVDYWVLEENEIVAISDLGDGTVKIASVKAAPSGEANWRAQIQQNNNGGKLTAGHTYKATVKAKINNADVNTLYLEFCANSGGNTSATTQMIFTAADTYQTFENVYTPAADVVDGAYRIGLLVGEYSAAYELIIDEILITEVTE